jgi:hypothetical protein
MNTGTVSSQSDVPAMFVYMQAKAQRYLDVGPEVYRSDDAFGMPPADATEEELTSVADGLRQLLEGLGLTAATPTAGLGIHGFNCLIETLHFETTTQYLAETHNGFVIDRMDLRHSVTGDTLTLFNKVDYPNGATG